MVSAQEKFNELTISGDVEVMYDIVERLRKALRIGDRVDAEAQIEWLLEAADDLKNDLHSVRRALATEQERA